MGTDGGWINMMKVVGLFRDNANLPNIHYETEICPSVVENLCGLTSP